MKNPIHHITLTVNDAEASATWYRSLLGEATVIHREGPGWKRVRLNFPSGLALGFTQHEATAKGEKFSHLTLEEINGKRSQASSEFWAAPPDSPPTSTSAKCSKQQQKPPLRTITIHHCRERETAPWLALWSDPLRAPPRIPTHPGSRFSRRLPACDSDLSQLGRADTLRQSTPSKIVFQIARKASIQPDGSPLAASSLDRAQDRGAA